MLSDLITEILSKSYTKILISTTAKDSPQINRLPDKYFDNKCYANVLVTSVNIAEELFKSIDGKVKTILIDVERKQEINLMEIGKCIIKKSEIIPYKPNDVTLEAADQLLLSQLGVDLTKKRILVYGTGNIAFKIALRLLEREVDVSLIGRNLKKTQMLVDTLNLVKPMHSQAKARLHRIDVTNKYDGIISFISKEKVIGEEIINHIRKNGFGIDGGIGNFKGEMIAKALEKGISIFRLDVRLGNPFLFATLSSINSENEFFNEIIGVKQLKNKKVVAGGIIGELGSVIVDRIKQPTQIIGIANGYGGVKNEKELTNDDREYLKYARETFIQKI